MTMLIKSKDLKGTEFTYKKLTEDTVKKLEEYGVLSFLEVENNLLYHLDLNSGLDYSTHVPYIRISIAKGRRTYGGTSNLWECAILYRRGVRGVMGYLVEDKIIDYVNFIVHLSHAEGWVHKVPREFYNHRHFEEALEQQERLLNEKDTVLPV